MTKKEKILIKKYKFKQKWLGDGSGWWLQRKVKIKDIKLTFVYDVKNVCFIEVKGINKQYCDIWEGKYKGLLKRIKKYE